MLNEIKKKGKWITEDYIQGLMKKHGMNHSEIEDIIKTADFTDDNKNLKVTENSKGVVVVLEIKPTSSKKIEKFVNSIRPGWTDHEVSGKRHHFYYDRYAKDFTDDGKEFNRSMLSELAHAWNVFMKSTDNAISMRARKLYHELYEHLNKELNKKGKKDFTDDRGTPVVNELIRVLDRLMFIIDRQQGRLAGELDKMSDKESDKLYKHKFLREFKIDIIP